MFIYAPEVGDCHDGNRRPVNPMLCETFYQDTFAIVFLMSSGRSISWEFAKEETATDCLKQLQKCLGED